MHKAANTVKFYIILTLPVYKNSSRFLKNWHWYIDRHGILTYY